MKCFYHKSDLDGHASGAIVRQNNPECETIGVDYNDTLDSLGMVGEFQPGELVFVVDFSFSLKDMEYLNDHTKLVWIDHHKSAIEKCESISCAGVREIGKAGCELTWQYINPRSTPRVIKLLGRYDVWDHSNPDVLPFQYGFRTLENTLPDSDIWEYYLLPNPGGVDEVIRVGNIILNYERKQNEIYAKGMHYESEFEGLRAIVINRAFQNSKIFDSVYDPEKHDIMVLFGVKPGEFKYSLYSTKPEIDVSKIAVKYGGGGHAGAAGFYSKIQVI